MGLRTKSCKRVEDEILNLGPDNVMAFIAETVVEQLQVLQLCQDISSL